MGRVWSQTRPGPVSAARKMPSPPKIMFLMPGTRVIWKATLAWKAPTWPGWTRRISPGGEVLDDDFAGELEPGGALRR